MFHPRRPIQALGGEERADDPVTRAFPKLHLISSKRGIQLISESELSTRVELPEKAMTPRGGRADGTTCWVFGFRRVIPGPFSIVT